MVKKEDNKKDDDEIIFEEFTAGKSNFQDEHNIEFESFTAGVGNIPNNPPDLFDFERFKEEFNLGFPSNKEKSEELLNNKLEEIQRKRVFMINKNDLTEDNIDEYCQIIVKEINKRIGIYHNDFNKYIENLKHRMMDTSTLMREILSEKSLQNYMDKGNFDTDKISNLKVAKRCCQVISLALLVCPEYKCLYKTFIEYSGLKDRQARELI